MSSKYIMITNFTNHWDGIKRTSYTTNFISDDVKNNLEERDTIFVKIDSSAHKRILRVWEGRVSSIAHHENKIAFDVTIYREVKEYSHLNIDIKQPYWRFYEEEEQRVSDYTPPFFEKLLSTKEWRYFEDETFNLLKLLGINNVFKFTNQRGEADGFFKFENLAVIYDTTLEDDFETKKKTQMDNFCSQLQMGSILINEQNTMQTFHECQKQVWIITRGSSRTISKHNNILVKEISLQDIMELYLERLDSQCTTDALENKLRMIGN